MSEIELNLGVSADELPEYVEAIVNRQRENKMANINVDTSGLVDELVVKELAKANRLSKPETTMTVELVGYDLEDLAPWIDGMIQENTSKIVSATVTSKRAVKN